MQNTILELCMEGKIESHHCYTMEESLTMDKLPYFLVLLDPYTKNLNKKKMHKKTYRSRTQLTSRLTRDIIHYNAKYNFIDDPLIHEWPHIYRICKTDIRLTTSPIQINRE